MTTDPFESYAEMDPIGGERPDWDALGPVVLDTIDERAGPMTIHMTPDATETRLDDQQTPRPGPRRWVAPAAAVIALAVAAITVTIQIRDDVVDEPVASRQLTDNERLLVGTFVGTLSGDLGVGNLTMHIRPDGTFQTDEREDLCSIAGTWQIVEATDSFVADGRCGDLELNFVAEARPERLRGVVTTGDGIETAFDIRYTARHDDRPLSPQEEAFVGEWTGTATGPQGSATTATFLRADGTFSSSGESAFFAPISGRWEVNDAELLTAAGASYDGSVVVRTWSDPDTGRLEQRWSSSGTPGRFSGSGILEPAG